MIMTIINILFYSIVIKMILLGSDFNLKWWFKYRRNYSYWYRNRPTFKDYLKEEIEYPGYSCGLCGDWINEKFTVKKIDSVGRQGDTWGMCPKGKKCRDLI